MTDPNTTLKVNNTNGHKAPVVLCVSGGADSIALLHLALFSALDIDDGCGMSPIEHERLAVFHLNHCLRSEDSDADEQYVRDLCDLHNVPCRALRIDVEAEAGKFGGNVENAGREIRYANAYAYAQELADRAGVAIEDARILTAHSANDRAETFMMNAMRGSGLAGLSSIQPRRGIVVRPLLHLTHEELEQILMDAGVAWRTDLTNKDTQYLRSYVRYKVLPPMKQKMPGVIQKIGEMCDVLSDENDYMNIQAESALNEAVVSEDAYGIGLNIERLSGLHPAILRRVVALCLLKISPEGRFTSQNIEDVAGVVHTKRTSVHVTTNIDVRAEKGILWIRKLTASNIDACVMPVPGSVSFGNVVINAQVMGNDKEDISSYIRQTCTKDPGRYAFVDVDKLGLGDAQNLELYVSSPQSGDRIQPFGMGGKSKLVSDLLHDARIPTHLRDSIPVVSVAVSGSIVCVGGIRTDEQFSCDKSTKEFIQLNFN